MAMAVESDWSSFCSSHRCFAAIVSSLVVIVCWQGVLYTGSRNASRAWNSGDSTNCHWQHVCHDHVTDEVGYLFVSLSEHKRCGPTWMYYRARCCRHGDDFIASGCTARTWSIRELSQSLHFALPATAFSKYSQHSDSLLHLAIVIENSTAMILQACFIEILWLEVGRHSHFAQLTMYNCRRQCCGIRVISGQLGFVCFVWKMQSCLCFTFDISSPTFLLSPRVSAFTTEVVFKYCFTKRFLNVYSACRGHFCDCMKLNDRQCR